MNYITAYQMRISLVETANGALTKFLSIRNVSSGSQGEVNYLPFGSIYSCVLILKTNNMSCDSFNPVYHEYNNVVLCFLNL